MKAKITVIIMIFLLTCTVLSVVFVISGAIYWHFIYNPSIETPMWDANIETANKVFIAIIEAENREFEQNVERISAIVDSMLINK